MPRNKLNPLDQKIRLEISNNLKKYSRGITQASLSDKTGIPVSTLSGYFAQRSTPNAGTIQKIAEALGVNKSDLDPRYRDSSLISVETSDINKIYNALTPDRQQNVYNYANHQLEEQNNNVVKLSDYTDNVEHTETVYGAVSAGTGQYLDHEQPEQVVVRGSAPEHDFAVKVVGNSMEPTFNDGQIVYVNRLVDESEIRNNQFVIAEVNGDAFIKKLSFSDDYVKLISLNPNYDDIIIHDYDDFLIRGIVVI